MKQASLCIATIGLAASSAWASAGVYTLHKNDVIPVTFDEKVQSKGSHIGDTFYVSVKDSSTFPMGTKFEGKIVKLEEKNGSTPASMNIKFDEVILPNSSPEPIEGVAVPIDTKYVTRAPDGKYTAKKNVSGDTAIGAGAIGGLLLGTMIHKPFEGAFLGTLAGMIFGATQKPADNVVIPKGSSAGVLIQHDVSFDPNQVNDQSMGVKDPILPVSNESSILVGQTPLKFTSDNPVISDGPTVLVPAKLVAQQLGLNYDETDSAAYIDSDAHSLRLVLGTSQYRIDGQQGNLPSSIVRKHGAVYVPLSIFGILLNEDVTINGTKIAQKA